MREILFRGKRMDNGRWVYGDYHKFTCTTSSITPVPTHYIMGTDASSKAQIWVDPTTVGQYTGLQDKNGNKIFEGDILQYTDCSEFVFAVVYGIFLNDDEDSIWRENVGFYCDWIKFSSCIEPNRGLIFCANKSKIIGNIHDNHELLEEKF